MRIGKLLNRTFVLPLLVVMILLAVLLFSQPGLRFSVWVANKVVDELTIGDSKGAWLSGISLSDVSYKTDSIEVELNHLSLRLQKRCLIQLRLCVPELKVSDANIHIADTAQPAPDEQSMVVEPDPSLPTLPELNTGILFPIPIRIEQLVLDNIALQLPGQQLTWQHFSIGIVAWGNRLQLSEGRWHNIDLSLTPNEQVTEPLTAYVPPQLPEITLPLSIYLDDFQLTDFSFKQAELQEHLSKLTLSAQLTPRQIRILDATAVHEFGRLQLAANVNLQQHYPLNLQADAQLLAGEFSGQRVQIQLSGDVAHLQADLHSSGPINAELTAELALLTEDLPLQLSLRSEQLQWPLTEPLYQLQHTSLAVHGSLSKLDINLNSQFTGQDLPTTTVQATANWQQWQQTAELDQLTLTTLGGEITAHGSTQLSNDINWQLAMEFKKLQPELTWPDYPGVLNGRLQTTGSLQSNGDLSVALPELQLNGDIRALPFALKGSLTAAGNTQQDNWQLQTPALTLSHGNNRVELKGQLAEQWQLDGIIDLPELAASYPELRGKIDGTFTLRGAMLTPDIALNLAANDLRYQKNRLQNLALDAKVSLADPMQSHITLNATQGRFEQQRLQQLALELSGNQHAHQLSLQLSADDISADLLLTGTLKNNQLWQGQFEQVALETPAGPWQLVDTLPLSVGIPKQQLMLAKHCWQQAPTQLCLNEDASISAQAAAAKLSLTDYQLAQLNPLLPYASTLQGDLALDVTLDWKNGQAPSVNANITGSSGTFTQQLDVPISMSWSQLALNAALAQHQLRSQLDLQLGTQGNLHAQLLVSDLDKTDKPLRAELNLNQLTLDFLKPLLDEYSELSGVISSQLSVNGSLAEPELQGELRLDALKVKGKLAPTDIENADLIVHFRGDQAALNGQVKTPEGLIDLSGEANWQELDNWQAALNIKGDALRLQVPQAELFVKPDLQITAQPGRSKVSGLIQIPNATITVDSLPQNAIGLSADQILLNRQLQPITEAATSQFALETDIRVQLGPRVRLSAFGLKTRLIGDLRVQQQQVNPTVRGEVALQDGTFRAYGQDLLIRQGKMTFNGPADQPFLNVEAIRNPANMEDDVIAGIRVTGPADEPVISIFSEPSKPQANALSYLIMGRDLDSESGSAANSVTTSLIGMSIASSGKLVGEIGEAFGVSDLTLDTEGAGDNSQVTVSGYLTRDLQLKYGIGIFQPIGQFTLRYRLMRSLFLEAISGLDNAVDLLYKFEFD